MANLILTINKEERYSRVARLSDTRNSAMVMWLYGYVGGRQI